MRAALHSALATTSRRRRNNRWVFGLALAITVVGVLLQLPDMAMMLKGSDMDASEMAGMAMWTPTMTGGMLLLVVGVGLGATALVRGAPRSRPGAGTALDAIDHGRFRPIHGLTLIALATALVVDIMKPLTLGFVLPGMSREYGLSLATVSLLPLVALTGTAIGSVVWGLVGDRYGRRTAFMLAVLLFTATSACGAMPALAWNLFMCFVMGLSAGGMLPLAFTLAAELTPRRHRGWIAVLLGGVGGIGGYLAASSAAHYLEPVFGWRVLWLVGLPSGLLLLAMMPLVPESPLFLLRIGRRTEGQRVLARYGARARDAERVTGHRGRVGTRALLHTYPKSTLVIVTVGLVWGLVNFGFLVLLPSQLRDAGMTGSATSGLLAKSALYSVPALLLVVLLYATWSARRTLVLSVAGSAAALVGVAIWSIGGLGDTVLIIVVGMLVLAQSATNAILLPYSAEIYPTLLRATGTGIAAAATKAGGILGPYATVLAMTLGSGVPTPAFVLALLAGLAAVLLYRAGPDVGRASPVPGNLLPPDGDPAVGMARAGDPV